MTETIIQIFRGSTLSMVWPALEGISVVQMPGAGVLWCGVDFSVCFLIQMRAEDRIGCRTGHVEDEWHFSLLPLLAAALRSRTLLL